MKRFVDLADLSRDEVSNLLELARRLEEHPEPQALAGKILGMVFFNPSLRTLRVVPGGHVEARRHVVRDHARPGHLAARDEARRRDEWRRGGARARRHSGARVLL